MYKLLIVDDESIIREGILANIDFAAMGIEVVGSCENGMEAIDVFRDKSPDIILTDINMPFMDGMELAETLLEEAPLLKVVILTGYDRFDYAQQALKLKISDYLVKPVLPRDIKPVLKKLIKQIESERMQEESLSNLREQLSETLPILRDRFLNSLITRAYSTRELEGKLRSNQINLDAIYYQLLCVNEHSNMAGEPDYNKTDERLTRIHKLSLLQIEGLTDAIAFRTYYDNVALIIGGDSKDDVAETARLVATRMEEICQSQNGLDVGIGISSVRKGLEGLSESYKEANEALEFESFRGSHHIICYDDIAYHNRDAFDSADYASRMYKEFRSGNTESILELVDEFFVRLEDRTMSGEKAMIHIQNVVMSIMLSIQDQGIEVDGVLGGKNPTVALYDHESLSSIKTWMRDLCKELTGLIFSERETYQKNQSRLTVDYVDKNYCNQELSLKQACEELSMSVSYFSNLFKEATGTTFVDYLTTLRMDKAKELLRNTDLKTYEIADKVGFRDAHYFSLVFKKQTGMTATAFRESVR